jgi:hypothetical protein
MATIRTVRATDIVPLIAFLRKDTRREVTARVWPRVGEDADWKAAWRTLAPIIAAPGRSARSWAYITRDGVRSVALARARVGGIAWDVEELHLAAGDWLAGVELLDYMAVGASGSGVRRVFLATSPEADVVRIAKQAGFVNYASETLYATRLSAPPSAPALEPPRPRLHRDLHALFQLYNAAVPCRVRSAEALTLDEWSVLNSAGGWPSNLSRSRQELVWERDGAIIAWLRTSRAGRNRRLELLVHPSYLEKTEQMVRYTLSRLRPQLPIYFPARHYQPELASALEAIGFQRAVDCLVFARELTVRVPGRAFIPVRA